MGDPFRKFGVPHQATLGRSLVADGVVVGTLRLPDDPQLGAHAGQPALLFHFSVGGVAHPPIVFIPGGDIAGMPKLLQDAIDLLPEAAAWSPPPQPPETFCPGCGRLLHATAASRGACFSCYPTIPGDLPDA